MNAKPKIEVSISTVESNGWVDSGKYYSAMFRNQPETVKGCPAGRSQISVENAVADLFMRANSESGTVLKSNEFEIVVRDYSKA